MSHTTETKVRKSDGVYLALTHNSDFSGDVEFLQLRNARPQRMEEVTVDGKQFVELSMEVVAKYLQSEVLEKQKTMGSKVAVQTAITVLEHLLGVE